MNFVIRAALPEDVPPIVRQRRAMFEELGYGSPALLDRMAETFGTWVADQIATGGYRGWMAVNEQGEAVGSGGLRIRGWGLRWRDLSGRQGYVVGVYVEPAARGQGLGRGLMRTMMEWCRDHGLVSLILHPSEQACDLYLSMGFVQEGDAYIWTP